nr:hypothetical protein 2 [bacterium]
MGAVRSAKPNGNAGSRICGAAINEESMGAPINFSALKKELVRHEGMRLKPYLCPAGKLTMGVGRNLEDRGITEEEADFMLNNDLNACIEDLDHALEWWRDLPLPAREVLVNMTFNLGIKGLLGFRNALAAFQAQDWQAAAKEMLDSRWARQVGPRAEELAEKVRGIEGQRSSVQAKIDALQEQIDELRDLV